MEIPAGFAHRICINCSGPTVLNADLKHCNWTSSK